MEKKERYITLSDRQIKDTQNQSQCFLSIQQICNLLNLYYKRIKELNTKLVEEMELSSERKQIIEDLTTELNELTKSVTMGKIFELQQENQQLKQQLLEWQDGTIICKLTDAENKVEELKQQLAITEKSLELACEMLCGLAVWDKTEFDKAIKDNYDYFMAQAKEMLENE